MNKNKQKHPKTTKALKIRLKEGVYFCKIKRLFASLLLPVVIHENHLSDNEYANKWEKRLKYHEALISYLI